MKTLQKGWVENLSEIFNSVDKELVISSPYISDIGAKFLVKNINSEFQKNGVLKFVTDLSPKNIYQGSTDPNSFKLLFNSINSIQIFHLPRLHAKVYVSDEKKAIVTSGNLTAGGIYNNFEYGIFLDNRISISKIKNDLVTYANLGAIINYEEINSYCLISEEIKQLFRERENSSKKVIEAKFKKAIEKADTELIKAKIGSGALHSVFEKTIFYLLQKNNDLTTIDINSLIAEIHPDLCDNEVDRVINGVHFGKKWKHAVRTAQQNLKKKGLIKLEDGVWKIISQNH
jgi:hypothetical protein